MFKKTLIGIVTFGNSNFTKMAVRGIRETVGNPYNIFIVVGMPGDSETLNWLATQHDIDFIVHTDNRGFPASINDIYDYAWKSNNFDNLIIMGNDVIPYPGAINYLIEVANTTDYEWVCAREYDVRSLIREFPEVREYFRGNDLVFTDFESRPWEITHPQRYEDLVLDGVGLSDCHNLTLFKKSVFDKIGYIDVNFYPAYYEDNDYVRRAVHAEIKSATVVNSVFFHFWSRTIKQGTGGSTAKFFQENREFYITKWNGDFAYERFEVPFDGKPYILTDGVILKSDINISSREDENAIIQFWKDKNAKKG